MSRGFRRIRQLASASCLMLFLSHCTLSGPATAPNMQARPANQLSLASNACGPTALLNALRFGSAPYQQSAAAIKGNSDREQIRHLILTHGRASSSHIPGQARWTRRGVNAADLTDIARDCCRGTADAPTLFIPNSSLHTNLAGIHKKIANSMHRGFPPIASLRRYDGIRTIDSHFITIIAISAERDENATSMPITYIDPLGGKKLSGSLVLTPTPQGLRLEANLSQTPVGRSRASDQSYLKLDAFILCQ